MINLIGEYHGGVNLQWLIGAEAPPTYSLLGSMAITPDRWQTLKMQDNRSGVFYVTVIDDSECFMFKPSRRVFSPDSPDCNSLSYLRFTDADIVPGYLAGLSASSWN